MIAVIVDRPLDYWARKTRIVTKRTTRAASPILAVLAVLVVIIKIAATVNSYAAW